MINERFPHQVIALASTQTGDAKNLDIMKFIVSVGGSLQGHAVFSDGEWHRITCFREHEHADEFQRRFGGKPFDFRLLGRNGNWATLREKPKAESKLERWQRVSAKVRKL